jgi:hypothetical protein
MEMPAVAYTGLFILALLALFVLVIINKLK